MIRDQGAGFRGRLSALSRKREKRQMAAKALEIKDSKELKVSRKPQESWLLTAGF